MKRTFMIKGYLGRASLLQAGILLGSMTLSYAIENRQLTISDNSKLKNEHPAVQSHKKMDIAVKGKVVDEQNNPLPGVSILIKGSQSGTATDADGIFELSVPNKEAVLIFSYVGFVPQEVAVGSKTDFQIQLLLDDKALEEVVVVGYGSQTKREI